MATWICTWSVIAGAARLWALQIVIPLKLPSEISVGLISFKNTFYSASESSMKLIQLIFHLLRDRSVRM